MTFQQKNFTVSLVVFILILLFYLFRLLRMNQTGTFTEPNVFRLWGIVVVLAIFATITVTILTHIVSGVFEAVRTGNNSPLIEDIRDERDDLIDLKGTKVTYRLTSLGSLIAMLTFVFGQPPLIMFSLLVLFGLMAQIAGDITRLRHYQMGF